MHLNLKDAVTLDILLEHLQNSAIRDGEITVAERLGTLREHLPNEGGAPDETLVLHVQTTLTPLLESNGPDGPPEAIKVRIREIFGSLDRGRSSH